MSKEESLVLWKTRIESAKRSGQRVADWCRENNITKSAYYYWNRKVSSMESSETQNLHIFAKIPSDKTSSQLEGDNKQVDNKEALLVSWKDLSLKVNNPKGVSLAVELLQRLGVSC